MVYNVNTTCDCVFLKDNDNVWRLKMKWTCALIKTNIKVEALAHAKGNFAKHY